MQSRGTAFRKYWYRRLFDYARFGWDLFIARRNRPYVTGLVITDICNLACRHCRVANIRHHSMSFAEIGAHMRRQYDQGVRFLYLEGGEPYLWQDGQYRLADVIELAKQTGFYRIHVYTNGTVPLVDTTDFTWVSIDGLGKVFEEIRGIPLEQVMPHVRAFRGKCGIVFTVNTINRHQIREFLDFVQAELPGIRVMFYFHTPYYGFDELFLSPQQRRAAVETIIGCARDGLPVQNSVAGLDAMQSGRFFHPTNMWRVIDETGDYQCCRACGHPEVCANCGYSSAAEVVLARNLRPGPLWMLMRLYM